VGIIDIILGWEEAKVTLPTLPWKNFERTDKPEETNQSARNAEIIQDGYAAKVQAK